MARTLTINANSGMAAYGREYFGGETHVRYGKTQPHTDNVLVFSNLKDGRVLRFWLLQLAGTASLVFWAVVAIALSKIPIASDFPSTGYGDESLSLQTSSGHSSTNIPADNADTSTESPLIRVSIDVWCSLSLTVGLDALATVATFNRALVRRFHYAVCQRMMFLVSMVSYAIASWEKRKLNLGESVIIGFALYILLGYALNKFETPTSSNDRPCRWGSIQQYSGDLGTVEMSWKRAQILTVTIGGFGLWLTMLIPPPWSALVPVAHILCEAVILSIMRAKKTPRYLILCAPIFLANTFVHWGITPLAAYHRLAIKPSAFLALVLVGRLLFDAHLWTTLRSRPELHWARKEVVISTRKLLSIMVVMILLEYMGLNVVTYLKPAVPMTLFVLGSAGFLSFSAYNLAVKKPRVASSSYN